MHMYLIRRFGTRFHFVFAFSQERAAELFLAWTVLNDEVEKVWSVVKVNVDSIDPVPRQHSRDALSLGIEGIGDYDYKLGWTIKQIDDERLAPVQLLDRRKSP